MYLRRPVTENLPIYGMGQITDPDGSWMGETHYMRQLLGPKGFGPGPTPLALGAILDFGGQKWPFWVKFKVAIAGWIWLIYPNFQYMICSTPIDVSIEEKKVRQFWGQF